MRFLASFCEKFKKIFTREETIFKGLGMYSVVEIRRLGSRLKLYTGNKFLQSSYDPKNKLTGNVWEWSLCAPVFSGKFSRVPGNVLVLGLGGGSVVKLYNRVYKVNKFI